MNKSFARRAWVDNKIICAQNQGNWQLFNNDCADNCQSKFNYPVCTSIITYNCECGTDKCWDKDRCVSDKIIKQLEKKQIKKYQEKQAKEKPQNITVTKITDDKKPPSETTNLNNKNDNLIKTPELQKTIKIPTIIVEEKPTITQNTNDTKIELCKQQNGVWKEFANGCVDNCSNKISKTSICTNTMTFGCECGQNKCWDNSTKLCTNTQKYKESITNSTLN